MPRSAALDPLAIVEASPAAVLRKDQPGWVSLFTEDALVEDPVGAAQYRGHARLRAFWGVFIAPQQSIVFHPHRDFVSPTVVVRQVTIATVTPVSSRPLEVEAILEYRLQGPRVASMRAFWDPRGPVAWHQQQGPRGVLGLVRHGGRLVLGLGPGAALAFGRAMLPALRPAAARAMVERIAAAPREAWLEAMRGARLEAVNLGEQLDTRDDSTHGPAHEPAGAFAGLRRDGRPRRAEAITVAGSHVAAILVDDGPSDGPDAAPDVAMIARVDGGRIADLLLLGR